MRQRGFSLAETIVVMALFSVLLAVFAGVIRSYSEVSRYSSLKDESLNAALVGLDRARSEAAEAIFLVSPAAGSVTPSAVLEFHRIDPQRIGPPRLPLTPPGTPPLTWLPHQPADRLVVRYEVLNRQLDRQVGGQSQPVCSNVTGFSSLWLAGGGLEIRISVQEDKRVEDLATRMVLHLPGEEVPP